MDQANLRARTAISFDLPVEIFERHETGDALDVFGRIALVGAFNRRQLANSPIMVSSARSSARSSRGVENGYQPRRMASYLRPLARGRRQPLRKRSKSSW